MSWKENVSEMLGNAQKSSEMLNNASKHLEMFSNVRECSEMLSNDGMRWVWRGRIGKCEPNSEKLGVQYGPTAAGRRSVLHPQFRRMRSAFTDVSEPDSPHTHCYYVNWSQLLPTLEKSILKLFYPSDQWSFLVLFLEIDDRNKYLGKR